MSDIPLKQIIDTAKKLKMNLLYRTFYFWYREHLPINDKMILVESVEGNNPMDNVAAIVEELALNPVYQEIQERLGLKVAEEIYAMFKGQQVSFPMRLSAFHSETVILPM